MKKRFLCAAVIAGIVSGASAQANPAYDKKMGEYMVHLQEMKAETERLEKLVEQFDKTSSTCLSELQAGEKGKTCIVMTKDKMDFEHEHRTFRTYNRIRKVPKFEAALQDMMQMEMFSLPKDEANDLFKTHMDAKSQRQANITVMGQRVYGAIDRFNAITEGRLEQIKSLKEK